VSDAEATLEGELPSSLPVGRGTAILVRGTLRAGAPLRGLELVVDGERHGASAWGMPRDGFWGAVQITPRERPGTVELAAAARLAGGAEAVAPLGGVEIVEPERTQRPRGASIAICMATFDPNIDLFRRQVESLASQTETDWICVISDDCSPPERFEEILAVVGGDERFVVSRSERRLGFYRNFERTLGLVPADAGLVALCDHDDRWFPEKLAVLRASLGSAQLVYSDQRLVDAGGRLLRKTLWEGRSNNHTSLASLLVANTITGAATLFRREVAELALPFPDVPGYQFHDHWIGLVALASGDVAYVDRPLYDYVQHAGAVFGDVSSGGDAPPRSRRDFLTRWRASYFYGYLCGVVQARALLARLGPRVPEPKRRTLERFIAAERSPAGFAWLAARPVRALAGHTETLGSEGGLALGIVWRGLATAAARLPGPVDLDGSLPGLESFEQRRLRRWRARV
jgi:hypothetical protein